tara:strand:- start:258 stop:818 length:561 start_codon:yes stop_codon:yes gene_type:complete
MPPPGLVSGSILSFTSSKTPQMTQLALAVEKGLYEWLLTTKVAGVASGLPPSGPPGQLTGVLSVVPNYGLMESAFKGNGIVGPWSSVMWVPIMAGVCKPYTFTGQSVGVGAGGFAGVFVGDPFLLTESLYLSFGTNGIVGPEAFRICSALGQGICALFIASQAVGGIVGTTVAPGPLSAPATGFMI